MTQVTRPTTSLQQPALQAPSPVAYHAVEPVGIWYLLHQARTALPLMCGDALAIYLAVALAHLIAGPILGWPFGFTVGFLCVTTIFGLRLLGLYPAIGVHPAFEMKRVLTVVSLLSGCLLLASFSREFAGHSSWRAVAVLWLAWGGLAPTTRSVTRSIFKRFDWWAQPVVFLGAGPVYQSLSRELESHRCVGLRPVGFFHDTRQQWFNEDVDDDGFLGDINEAPDYARRNRIYWTIVLDPVTLEEDESAHTSYSAFPHRLFHRNASDSVPSIWDEFFYINRHSFIRQTDKLLLPHNLWFKRGLDILLALLLTIISGPLVLALALLVKLTSRGTVFYKSERIGAEGERFHMTKFRTMRADADAYLQRYLEQHPEYRDEWQREQKLRNDPRITWIGRFLRRTSLDELPQIYDVLVGKMSLVGPRPMLLGEPTLYGPHYQSFCRMFPGMTGLWQVSGRNRIPHDQRTLLVSYYVQNWSPWLDLYLLAKTVKVVITGDGAY